MKLSLRCSRRATVPLLAVPLLLAACGGTDATTAPLSLATTPGSTPGAGTPGATATAAAQPAGGAIRFDIVPQESTATYRVREQLANVPLANDAVGTTGAVSGQITFRPDGTIVGEASKISVDLREIKSDRAQRDTFIKRNTLQTDQFPTAEFVPTQAIGLPSPLPASGEHSFKLTGRLTLHGVQKDSTWDVTARREGNKLTGAASTAFKFAEYDMTIPRVALVLSIVDEIRLEINLVANQAV